MIDLSLIAAQIREDVKNMEKTCENCKYFEHCGDEERTEKCEGKEVKEDEGTGKSPNTLQQK